MPGLHNNKTIIVTGGAGSLGLAVVQSFLTEGANVVATDIQDSLLAALPDAIDEEHRSRLLPYKCNSADDSEVQKLIAATIEKFGRLDVLINNAAINDKLEPTGDCSREMWDRNILVNLTGPFVTSQNAIRQFLKQEEADGQRGVILNVISAAGQFGGRAGKCGLFSLTKAEACKTNILRRGIYRFQARLNRSYKKYSGVLWSQRHTMRCHNAGTDDDKHG